MDLIRRRYAMILLFILICDCVVNFAEVQADKPKILTTVLQSFLKVPWVNLNSSWEDAVTTFCRDDIVSFHQSSEAGEMWALKMLDASSKVPPGILIGNIRDLGMFDECLKVQGHGQHENIRGKHCMVSMKMPTKFFGDISEILSIQKVSVYNPNPDDGLSLTTSVCLPSSCDEPDINGLVSASIASEPELTAFEISVAKVKCSSFGPPTELTFGSILVMSFFVMITVILLCCTACEFVLRARSGNGSMALKIASKFSLYTNFVNSWSTNIGSDTMPALNGFRILSTCLVVLGHRIVSVFIGASVNASDAIEMKQTALYAVIFSIPLVTDTFFLLSGFLVTLSYMRMFRSGKSVNIFLIYFRRYLRLTPCLAIVLLFTIFVIPIIGSGPNWESIYEVSVTFCQKNWWTNLLYVQNIINVEEMCLLHTWYMAVEMQLYFFSPIVLYPLFYRPKLGLLMLGSLLIAAFLIPGIQLAVNQWVFFWDFDRSAGVMYSEFMRSYTITYNRALPYLIGIFLGYDVFHNKRRISRVRAASNWILASSFVLFCIWNTYCIQPTGIVYDVMWEVIFVSVARLVWSLAVAWTIYAITQGHGGPVTKFLSLPIFVPVARLSYNIYLVHVLLQATTMAIERTAEYRTPLKLFYAFWGDLVLSIIFASVLYVCIESPICTLIKMLISGRPSANIAHGWTAKQTTLPAAVGKCLDPPDDKSDSNFDIATITTELDFWQSVSETLNELIKGPVRTPKEWTETWRNWRSELLHMENVFKAQSICIRNEGFNSQTKVTAIEKDLIIFLATMSRPIDDTKYKPSEDMKSKSYPNIDHQQHGDSFRLSIVDLDINVDVKSQFPGCESVDAVSKL